MEILILYLGSSGAGPGLTYSFTLECIERNTDVTLATSKRNELREKYFELDCKKEELNVPNSFSELFNVFRIFKLYREVRKLVINSDVVFIPMLHPLLVLYLPLLSKKSKLFSAIHDAKPHEGDNGFLVRIANTVILRFSKNVFVFSNNQRHYILDNYNFDNVDLLRHPSFRHYNFSIENKRHRKLVFIGRIEKYKGLPLLLDTAKIIYNKLGIKIQVFGRVSDKSLDLLLRDVNEIDYFPGYLQDRDLKVILEASECIILPYSSATQSGVMVLACDAGCKVVATPVDGLIEQAEILSSVYLSRSTKSIDFVEAIYYALSASKVKNSTINSGLVDYIIHE